MKLLRVCNSQLLEHLECRSFKRLCSLPLQAVIITPEPVQVKQQTRQACEGEALSSVCKVCFSCDWISLCLFNFYSGGIFVPQLDLHEHLTEPTKKLEQLCSKQLRAIWASIKPNNNNTDQRKKGQVNKRAIVKIFNYGSYWDVTTQYCVTASNNTVNVSEIMVTKNSSQE